jgi:hypothetical protein
MTTIERPLAAQYCRCAELVGVGVQCELLPDHQGVHAIGAPDGFLTWDDASERRWRLYPPPPWLIALPWATGFQPDIRRSGLGAGSGRIEVDERYLRAEVRHVVPAPSYLRDMPVYRHSPKGHNRPAFEIEQDDASPWVGHEVTVDGLVYVVSLARKPEPGPRADDPRVPDVENLNEPKPPAFDPPAG